MTDPATTGPQRFVYDGLVARGLSSGSDSQLIVPDLAQGLPLVSDGDKIYAFTLRPGLRYSTGVEVRATDFRTALRKALTVGAEPENLANILGGRNCIRDAATCDLAAGLKTDDSTRRVTFILEKPDSMFAFALARFLYPVPRGTPATVSSVPVPGTGPYLISTHLPDRFTLQRNRFFTQRSFAAQPAGYPAVIDFRKVASARASADEVIAGRADLGWVDPGSGAKPATKGQSLMAYLRSRYPDGEPYAVQLRENVLDQRSLLVSPRVGNYQSNPDIGPLLSQIWVR